ncbi:hypothetical protein HK096_002829 [Nowakowskiella sp. JEL0078]|nr:hypothetical protein HK096_002829 [Nowakowskiella sp. JEL0078]
MRGLAAANRNVQTATDFDESLFSSNIRKASFDMSSAGSPFQSQTSPSSTSLDAYLNLISADADWSVARQLEQAVPFLALGNKNDEILLFCNDIASGPALHWKLALSLFFKFKPQESFEAIQIRYFCLNILVNLLSTSAFASLTESDRRIFQSIIWAYLVDLDTSEPVFIRSKFPLILSLVVRNQYPHEWPSFFDDLLNLLQTSTIPNRIDALTDLFIRISLELDSSVVQVGRQLVSENARTTLIKDTMRETGVVNRYTTVWYSILSNSISSNPELAALCLQCFAVYVAWIDINLVVTDHFLSTLYNLLGDERLQVQAVECIEEILGKGMLFPDKLQLIRVMRIDNVLTQLEQYVNDEDEMDEFVGTVAKLLNKLGLEICRCYDESIDENIKNDAFNLLMIYFPFLLKYLGSPYDDTSSLLSEYTSKFISIVGRAESQIIAVQKQQGVNTTGLGQEMQQKLIQLLDVVVRKMKYDEEEEHKFGADADELDAEFLNMRLV